jgi:hypothetical protein
LSPHPGGDTLFYLVVRGVRPGALYKRLGVVLGLEEAGDEQGLVVGDRPGLVLEADVVGVDLGQLGAVLLEPAALAGLAEQGEQLAAAGLLDTSSWVRPDSVRSSRSWAAMRRSRTDGDERCLGTTPHPFVHNVLLM